MKDLSGIRVLLCDDERDFRMPLAQYLRQEGCRVFPAADAREAMAITQEQEIDVLLTDYQMPGLSGLDLLKQVKAFQPGIQVVVFTAFGTVETAVQAIQLGAADFVLKPVLFPDVRAKILRLAEKAHLVDDPAGGDRQSLDDAASPEEEALAAMIGSSPELVQLKEIIRRVSKAGSFALIQGESGTGKELVARALHRLSRRADKPFVAVNSAAIPEQLLESEFFGYAKGAFTGANTNKVGYFESSHQGTLFLDEVVDLPMSMQVKLLRAIEEHEIMPVGSTVARPVDLTIIAACGRSLAAEVAQGGFRGDLFYRINVIEINVPPLRERQGDVRELANHFLVETCQRLEVASMQFSEQTLQIMEDFTWPGNIRQLRNVVERAVVLSSGDLIEARSLPPELAGLQGVEPVSGGDLKDSVRRYERQLILRTIASCDNDKKMAAKLLGMGLSSLYRKLEEFEAD